MMNYFTREYLIMSRKARTTRNIRQLIWIVEDIGFVMGQLTIGKRNKEIEQSEYGRRMYKLQELRENIANEIISQID